MTTDLSALIARLEAGPVYLTHKEAYGLAIFFGSDAALGMASLIRKAFAGGSLDAALALTERVLGLDLWKVRTLSQSYGGEGVASLVLGYPSGTWSREARSAPVATAALALVIAILRAKQGEGE